MQQSNESRVDVIEIPATEFQNFILGGIRAVIHSPVSAQDGILSDIADALNCPTDALRFLIEQTLDSQNNDLDFPDAQRRRRIAFDNRLMVAE